MVEGTAEPFLLQCQSHFGFLARRDVASLGNEQDHPPARISEWSDGEVHPHLRTRRGGVGCLKAHLLSHGRAADRVPEPVALAGVVRPPYGVHEWPPEHIACRDASGRQCGPVGFEQHAIRSHETDELKLGVEDGTEAQFACLQCARPILHALFQRSCKIPEGVLRRSQVVDVRVGPKPASRSGGVFHANGARLEPSISAVGASNTKRDIEGGGVLHGEVPRCEDEVPVIYMHSVRPAIAKLLGLGNTGISDPLRTEEITPPIIAAGPNQLRQGLDQSTLARLTLAEPRFGLSPGTGDVLKCLQLPPHNLTGLRRVMLCAS